MGDMSAYQEMFLSEAREHLDALDAGMLLFEKNTQDEAVVKDLMRHAHTLKGVAASMGYGEISNLSHSFEGMVENIKNGLSPASAIQILFGAVDELRKLVEETQTGAGQEHGANPLVDQVGELEQTDKKQDSKVLDAPKTFQVINEVKVKTEKLDTLVDLVSELSVNRLTLQVIHERLVASFRSSGIETDVSELQDVFDRHSRMIDDLQHQALQLRLTPLIHVFNRFPRMIRDLAKKLEKEIDFEVRGGEVELDRSILDEIGEPLVHLLRNAADHGIEKKGTIIVEARREQGGAVIEVRDNGRGINWSKLRAKHPGTTMTDIELLFSGTSTADKVSDISGRGVGVSTVLARMKEIGGDVDVESPIADTGKGTRFLLRFPISLAIIQAVVVRIDGHVFAFSITALERLLQIAQLDIHQQLKRDIFVFEEEELPYLPLATILGCGESSNVRVVMILQTKQGRIGIGLDEIITQQNVVVKPIPSSLRASGFVSSVTILGDGTLVPILDHEAIAKEHFV